MNWTKEAYQLFRRLKKHATKQIIVKIVGMIKVKHSMSLEKNRMIFFLLHKQVYVQESLMSDARNPRISQWCVFPLHWVPRHNPA